MLTIIVPDVHAHYANTKSHGATIWEELQETVYGEYSTASPTSKVTVGSFRNTRAT
jgi:hypothetical protein